MVVTRDTPIKDAEKVCCLDVLFFLSLSHELTGAFLRLEVRNDLRGNDNDGGRGNGDGRGTPAFILADNAICFILRKQLRHARGVARGDRSPEGGKWFYQYFFFSA